MYVRRYGYGLDLSLERTFNTKSKEKISKYCKKNKQFKWKSENNTTWKINNFSYYNKDIKSKYGLTKSPISQ